MSIMVISISIMIVIIIPNSSSIIAIVAELGNELLEVAHPHAAPRPGREVAEAGEEAGPEGLEQKQ